MVSRTDENDERDKPRLCAAAIWTQFRKVFRQPHDVLHVTMSPTLHRQAVVEIPEPLYHIKELGPEFFPTSGLEESVAVADDYEAHPSAGEEHVQPFRGRHKPNIPLFVTPRERYDDDIIFLALIVVYKPQKFSTDLPWNQRISPIVDT